MKKINVIDLDDTLLPFDSFGRYFRFFLLRGEFTARLLWLKLLRRSRGISASEFKRSVMLACRQAAGYEKTMQELAAELVPRINQSVFDLVLRHTDSATTNVLCTASPADYTKFIAESFGWQLIASEVVGGELLHVHGENKVAQLEKRYPAREYLYNFAISDAMSDLPLLALFRNKEFLTDDRQLLHAHPGHQTVVLERT